MCKFIPKSALDDIEVVNSLGEEVRCLAALSHLNIVSFQRREDLANHVVLVFDPWFGDNMRTHIIKNGFLGEDQAQMVITQVASAVVHMHLKGFTHGAICLDNIVIKMDGNLDHVILAGFHQASSRNAGGAFKRPSLADANVYTAPEVFGSSAFISTPLDVWALGVVYFALLHGRLPFEGRAVADKTAQPVSSLQETSFDIKTGTYLANGELSTPCRFAIKSVFTLDPQFRPDVNQALRLFEGSVAIPSAFLSFSERGHSDDEAETLGGLSQHGSSHGNKAVKFPSVSKSSSSDGKNTNSTATLFVADPADGLKILAPLTDTYAKLTQMALTTLDRAKNAATQGRLLSIRNIGNIGSEGANTPERRMSDRTIMSGENSPSRRMSGRAVGVDNGAVVQVRRMSSRNSLADQASLQDRRSLGNGHARASFGSWRDVSNNNVAIEETAASFRSLRSSRSTSPAPESRRVSSAASNASLESTTAEAEAEATAGAMLALDNEDDDDISKSKRPLFKTRGLSSFAPSVGEFPPLIQKQSSTKVLLVDMSVCFV